MRRIKVPVHPLSIVLGSLVTLVLSAGSVHNPPRPTKVIIAEPMPGIPAPSQMVRVTQAQPFTVPVGKTLVVTGIGSGSPALITYMRIDGAISLSAFHVATDSSASVVPVPTGYVVGSGNTVTVEDSGPGSGVVMGYLADAL